MFRNLQNRFKRSSQTTDPKSDAAATVVTRSSVPSISTPHQISVSPSPPSPPQPSPPPPSSAPVISHSQPTPTSSFSSTTAAQRVKGLAAAASQAVSSLKRDRVATQQQRENDLWQAELSALSVAPHALSKFDACVDAADALAAGEGGHDKQLASKSRDEASGLIDCSVLVSPDGDLLLMPEGERRSIFAGLSNGSTVGTSKKPEGNLKSDSNAAELQQSASKAQRQAMFDELFKGKDDYESAVFLGHDLHPLGDRFLNRFSAKGWSIPATTAALQQTEQTMHDFTHFCEQLVLMKKEAAARTSIACDSLKSTLPSLGGRAPIISDATARTASPLSLDDDWECINPPKTDWDPLAPHRVGPFLAPQSSLNKAVMSTEQYYASVAESEANRWRQVSMQKGFLPKIRQSSMDIADRVRKRQSALDQTSQRARLMQARLDKLRLLAESKWEEVYFAEDRVTRKVEEIMAERSREREKQRIEDMQKAEQTRAMNAANGTLGATSEEIWDIVSSVSEHMDSGSFEPMDFPAAPLSVPLDGAKSDESLSTVGSSKEETNASEETKNPTLHLPVASREQIEHEMGLPELRAAAMSADDDVADAADALMGMLSSLDTTRRSARIAAETCLLSAGQAQAACIKALIKYERSSLEDRLRKLKAVEDSLEVIDVRADLDLYITEDKRERGGASQLGDDDDGGLASALAVLSSHVDGSMGSDSIARLMSSQDLSGTDMSDEATADLLDEYVEKIFEPNNEVFAFNDSDNVTKSEALKEFEDAIDVLCKTAAGAGSSARAKRSAICYALNSKRSMHPEIKTKIQFDALCRLFNSILTGCDAEGGNVSMAKMCIMLAQTFYLPQPSFEANGQDGDIVEHSVGSISDDGRRHRIYVKSCLQNHSLWSKDSFWDTALSQQISESLTHSGVLTNFERQRGLFESQQQQRKSEWTQTRKTKWYDLSYKERNEAAAQVHAVVFAQLGALAHSMIEFGCGLERSCAFVRRMSVRNQLPGSQRTMLLLHLMDRDHVEKRESSQQGLARSILM